MSSKGLAKSGAFGVLWPGALAPASCRFGELISGIASGPIARALGRPHYIFMTTQRSLALAFTLTAAVCRAEYPLGGGNHILHVAATEAGASRDGYIARSPRAAFYVTRGDRGWSAQRLENGVAANWYVRFDYPSRTALLAELSHL